MVQPGGRRISVYCPLHHTGYHPISERHRLNKTITFTALAGVIFITTCCQAHRTASQETIPSTFTSASISTETPVSTGTFTPTFTTTISSTPEPAWKGNIHVGPAGSMEELTALPFEEIDQILPVLRGRENEYLADKNTEPNETYISRTELIPGHPFSTFSVDVTDTWGEKDDLVVGSTNVLVDKGGKKYFLIGIPHLVRPRSGKYYDQFVWHYLVDLDAMKRYFVSNGEADLVDDYDPNVALQNIAQGLDRVLEMRVFVYGEPYTEVLIAGQGWQDIEPILRGNEEQFHIHSRIDQFVLEADVVGGQVDTSILTDLETIILPVTWFTVIK